jgi:hypothetical protein
MKFFTDGESAGPKNSAHPAIGAAGAMDIPPDDVEKVQIRIRLQELEIEHYDLDDVIRRLYADRAQDQLQLRRLKKRKLILKDQIQKLRARLIPDIIA